MKKITIGKIREFIKYQRIPLVPTQSKLCFPILFRMCRKMRHGIKFDEIKVCGNLIIDGHHRYISALYMELELGQVPTNLTSATEPVAWNKIQLIEEDWDTQARIDYLNELDARYNDLEIEYIRQITLK